MTMAITKRSSGRYQAKLRGSDGRWITKTVETKREAQDFEREIRAQMSQGGEYRNSSRKIRFDEYFSLWFETAQHEATISHRTNQKRIYEIHIKPYLGQRLLRSIAPPDISSILNRMQGKELSKQTQLHAYNLLRKMFRDAEEEHHLLNRNPVLRKIRPRVPVKETRYLTIPEARKLIPRIEASEYRLAIWLQFFLGLRVGEVQALRWEDIDLDSGTLHVRRGYARHEKAFRDHPKGKRQLVHKIPSELLEVLKEARETAETELVVVPKGYQMIEYSKYRKVLVQFCKEAGITTIATHGLRHSTSELYMEHGATVEDMRGLLGQRDTKTTQRYVHNRGSRLQDIAKVIRLFPECSQNVPKSTPEEVLDQGQESC
jgi:integrase